jgi:hypothetical protein
MFELQGVTRCQLCDPKLPGDLGKNCACADPSFWKAAGCKELTKLDPPLCAGTSRATKFDLTDRIEVISVKINPYCPVLKKADGSTYELDWCYCAPGETPPPGKTCIYP